MGRSSITQIVTPFSPDSAFGRCQLCWYCIEALPRAQVIVLCFASNVATPLTPQLRQCLDVKNLTPQLKAFLVPLWEPETCLAFATECGQWTGERWEIWELVCASVCCKGFDARCFRSCSTSAVLGPRPRYVDHLARDTMLRHGCDIC